MRRNPLARFTDAAYAALRVIAGLAFAFHGIQKIFGVMSDQPAPPTEPLMLVGGWIEIVAGGLIAIGLLTPLAAFIASGEMAVAYIQFHWKFQFDAKFFPTRQGGNDGELALVYCFLFLFMACYGSGRFSLAALFARRPAAFSPVDARVPRPSREPAAV